MGRGDRVARTGIGNRGEARWAVPSLRPGRTALPLWGWVQPSAPASHLTVLPRPPARAWLAPMRGSHPGSPPSSQLSSWSEKSGGRWVPTLVARPAPSFPPGQRRAGDGAGAKAAVLLCPGATCSEVRLHCICISTEYSLEGLMLMGRQWKQCQTLFFWAPKSLQTVTAAMKLKDAYSLEEKL